jgi:predicted HAD superfamily Cof-like phosphohydrolase
MKKQINQVTDFHRKIGETVAASPQLLQHENELDADLARSLRQLIEAFNRADNPKTQLTRRSLMAVEELAEWIEAHNEDDLTAAADAWADRMYVLLGDAVATGMPAEPLLDEVHRSNMTKATANASTGKGTKADAFESPAIKAVLQNPDVSIGQSCMDCESMMWMVGIGQGVQCRHPANQADDGTRMQIPNRDHYCEHFQQRSTIRSTTDKQNET